MRPLPELPQGDILTQSAVNGSWSCENDKMLNDIVKGEWGYPGCEYHARYLRFELVS